MAFSARAVRSSSNVSFSPLVLFSSSSTSSALLNAPSSSLSFPSLSSSRSSSSLTRLESVLLSLTSSWIVCCCVWRRSFPSTRGEEGGETTTPVEVEAGGDGVERAVVMGSVREGSSTGGEEEGRARGGTVEVGVGASERGEGEALGGLLGVELALRLFAAWNRLS